MFQLWKSLIAVVRPAGLAVAASLVLAGQSLKYLTPQEEAYLKGEISGDAAYEHLRHNTQFHRPRGGAEGLMEVARYYEQKAREYGLADVRLIKQKATYPAWNPRSAELWIVDPTAERIASTVQTPLHLLDNSRAVDVTAELVDVGDGTNEKDYEDKQVEGKIVLAWGGPAAVMKEAVSKRKAAGLVLRPDPRSARWFGYPDQVRWLSVPAEETEGRVTFAFGVSYRQGAALASRLASAKQPVKVHAHVDSAFGEEKWQVMVEGYLRGTAIEGQDIVLTGHMQEEKFSANDDGSGCANLAEIARTLAKLIREGRLAAPRRNIRFWWVTEIGSERQYFADHPGEARKILANINSDMVGANQGLDVLRVQNVTRLPFSRFHFLNDVAESVVEYLVEGNTSQLAMMGVGAADLYPRPIFARLGTRHRYNAAMVPFHNSTDHMTFNEAPIGVPGVTFTNFPDNYIHSTDDDLWNIDRTQLQRNAFAVATIAYFLARAEEKHIPILGAEVYGRSARRLGQALQSGVAWIAAGRPRAYADAVNLLERSIERDKRALESIKMIGPGNHAMVDSFIEGHEKLGQAYLAELAAQYRSLTGRQTLPLEEPSPVEKELQKMKPRLACGPAEFLERRNKVKAVDGLHSLMAFEALNFVDGRRTGLDIYRAVRAEAQAAPEGYYGTVEPGGVAQYLKNLAAAELVRLE
ncbi:MAG: M28 family peptidase [Acidobacteria bacterium]|nr:M28 family peptidase [Acidobacteriota bacterium]